MSNLLCSLYRMLGYVPLTLIPFTVSVISTNMRSLSTTETLQHSPWLPTSPQQYLSAGFHVNIGSAFRIIQKQKEMWSFFDTLCSSSGTEVVTGRSSSISNFLFVIVCCYKCNMHGIMFGYELHILFN